MNVTLWDGKRYELSAELADSLRKEMQSAYLGQAGAHETLGWKLAAACSGWDIVLKPAEAAALLDAYWCARERQDDLWTAVYQLLDTPVAASLPTGSDVGDTTAKALTSSLRLFGYLFSTIGWGRGLAKTLSHHAPIDH
jgi:hypothetical protein